MKSIFTACSYTNARVNEFFSLVSLMAQAAEAMLKTPEAQPLVAPLRTAVTNLDKALKQSDTNRYTATVEMADQAVDETWSGMWGMSKAMLTHPTLTRRSAAAEVYDAMRKYGNVTNLSYKEEYGRLRNLVEDLEAIGSTRLAEAYMDEWFAELKTRVAAYDAAEELRLSEEDARQVGVVKEARAAAEEALRLFLRKVDALVVINGEEGYTEFIARANTLLGEMKATLKSRRTKAKNESGGTPDSSLPAREPDPAIDTVPDDDDEETDSPSEI